jgi:hypothetical protein
VPPAGLNQAGKFGRVQLPQLCHPILPPRQLADRQIRLHHSGILNSYWDFGLLLAGRDVGETGRDCALKGIHRGDLVAGQHRWRRLGVKQ